MSRKKLTSELEETKEGHFIDSLLRVVDLCKETIMWVGPHGVVSAGNHGREGVRDIA